MRLGAICCGTFFLALAACTPVGEVASDMRVTIDSTGAYPVIRSAGEAESWHAELVATVGADSATEFGTVRSVLLDSTGALYVVDPSTVQLSVFDPHGALRARWGRRGAGPGEYTRPYSVAWLHDSLVLLDPGNSRITVYGRDAAWGRQWPAERITGGQTVRLYRTPPAGFWVYGTRPTADGLEGQFIRYTSAGPTDTVPTFRSPVAAGQAATCHRPDGGITFFSPPFGTVQYLTPTASSERLVALSTAYRIAVLGRSNDTLRVIERTATPAPLTDAEWDAELEEFRTFRRDWPTAHCDRTSFDRPATKPIIAWLALDDKGQLWVEALTADGRIYEVFGPDGILRATVTGLPASGGIDPSIVAGRIALVVPDSTGADRVLVFRVERGGPPR
jgi:hypothetical protein